MIKMEIKYKKVVDEYGGYYLPDIEGDEELTEVGSGGNGITENGVGENTGNVGDSQSDVGETPNDCDGESDMWIGKYGMLRLTYLKNHRRALMGHCWQPANCTTI